MKIRFPFFRRNERQKLSWLSNIGYLMQGGFPKKENFRDSLFFFSRSTNFRFHEIVTQSRYTSQRSTVSNKIGRASEANRESES